MLVQKGAPNNLLLGTDVQSQLGFVLLMKSSTTCSMEKSTLGCLSQYLSRYLARENAKLKANQSTERTNPLGPCVYTAPCWLPQDGTC